MAPTYKSIRQKSNKIINPKKRDKKVMSIATKIEILKCLDSGERISTLTKRYQVNESTIRSIRDNAKKNSRSSCKFRGSRKSD